MSDEAICREARAGLIRDALKWADWCAGQGICAVKSEGVESPDDFLVEYSDLTGDVDWTTLPERLAEQARLNGMGSEREAEAYRRGVEDAAKKVLPPAVPMEWMEASDWLERLAERKTFAAAIRSLTAPGKEGA